MLVNVQSATQTAYISTQAKYKTGIKIGEHDVWTRRINKLEFVVWTLMKIGQCLLNVQTECL